MLPRSYKTEGIVLKRKNVSEADKIITLYTKDFGRLQVKAVGVRKITSRRAAAIEPFNLIKLTLHKGRGMPILTEVETLDVFQSLKEDLQKVGFAYHLCELVDGLCPENVENEHIFSMLKDIFSKLSKEKEIFLLINRFEVELLILLGYWPKNKPSERLDTQFLIETLLEKKLKTKRMLSRLKG